MLSTMMMKILLIRMIRVVLVKMLIKMTTAVSKMTILTYNNYTCWSRAFVRLCTSVPCL